MGKEKRDLRRLTNAAMMSALVCIATLVPMQAISFCWLPHLC